MILTQRWYIIIYVGAHLDTGLVCSQFCKPAIVRRKPFEEENFRVLVQNENFAEKTFADCSGPIIMWVWPQKFAEKTFADCSGPIIMWVWPQKFAEKTFADGSKPRKMLKFSPSKVIR